MIEYTEYRLGQLCKRFSSGKGISADHINEIGLYPVIGGNGVRGYTDTYNFDGECAVIGRQGAYCGNVKYFLGKAYMTEHAVVTEPNKNNNAKYLTYKLDGLRLGRLSGQAAQPGLSVTKLARLRIKMPSKQYQDKVASMLSSYDDMIEVNNQRIKILEKMVENLYKEWFVRLRFPGYEATKFEDRIPTGWKRLKLSDVAIEVDVSVKTENRDQYAHYLPIDKLPSQSMALQEEDEITNAESSLISFAVGDILFGAMRPYFHKVIIAPFKGLTRTTCFVINSKDPVYRLFLYCLLFQKASIDYATTVSVGSTMPYVRWKDFSRMNVLLPDERTIKLFNGIVEPIMQRIVDSYEINKNLAKQRDLLLPRLMSGKLVV